MRYRLGLTFVITMVPLMIFLAIFGEGSGQGTMSQGLVVYSPFDSSIMDSLYVMLLMLFASAVAGVLAGYVLSPLYIFAHKHTIGHKMNYGIQEKSKSEKFKKAYLKSLFPSLLTLNLCLIFAADTSIQPLVVPPSILLSGTNMVMMIAVMGLFPIMSGISMGVFSSVWFLQDAGIVYTNKEKVKNNSDPTEIRSLGSWYLYLLKGYAGISVIFSYYIFLSELISSMGGNIGLEMIAFFALWPIMPLLIAFMFIPAMIVLDATFERRRAYVLAVAGKLGIKDKVGEPSFELKRE